MDAASGKDARVAVDARQESDGATDATDATVGAADAGDGAHLDSGAVDSARADSNQRDGSGTCANGAVCQTVADCPVSTTACITGACMMGCCGAVNAGAGAACTDNGGRRCDGSGACVACLAASDCPAEASVCKIGACDAVAHTCGATNAPQGTPCTDSGGVACSATGTCVASHCGDGKLDGDETDVDCGGSCAPCGVTEKCNVGSDCVSKICTSLRCAAPSCSDGVQNGNETATDCGGPQCDAQGKTCSNGQACAASGDCTSDACQAGACAPRANGQSCTTGAQCANGNCAGGVCCNTACAGACQACSMALTGQADGTCAAMSNGSGCSDGNACTQTDSCQAGTCTGSTPVTCTATDQCHAAGACDPATGACSNPPLADGTACNDNNGCTSGDACQGGICSGTFCASHLCGASLTAFTGAATPGWKLNGSASYDGMNNTVVLVDGLTIAEAGTAIYDDPIIADAFSVSFDFRVTATSGRADGIAFLIETDGATALGAGYGGFGALGLDGYGVELDVFESGPCDPANGNHAGIDLLSPCATNGGILSPIATSGDLYTPVGGADDGVGDIGDSQWRTATATLASGQLSVTITDPTTLAPVAIPALQDVALPGFVSGTPYYFGFGAGSGSNGLASRQEIRNVHISFSSNRCL